MVIGPSNPLVSIGPMLAIPGCTTPWPGPRAGGSAVSPIVGGRALKGPTDRMLASLGHEVSAVGVARLYEGLLDRYVLDETDAELAPAIEAAGHARPLTAPTVMQTDADRAGLARFLLETAAR